jgi:hypothetical protein
LSTNAGYGLSGCFEELSDEQIRQQMEVKLLRADRCDAEGDADNAGARSRVAGLIQQVTSIGGQRGRADV